MKIYEYKKTIVEIEYRIGTGYWIIKFNLMLDYIKYKRSFGVYNNVVCQKHTQENGDK